MPEAYLIRHFTISFFQNLRALAKSSILLYDLDMPEKLPVVFLPFTPHMFVNVFKHKLYHEYAISYLTIYDLVKGVHALYSVSEGAPYNLLTQMFELQMNDYDRYCITKKKLYSNMIKICL